MKHISEFLPKKDDFGNVELDESGKIQYTEPKPYFYMELSLNAEPDIETKEEAVEEMALLLEQVAKQVREGYTSGAYPSWDFTITEKQNEKTS